jgi:hypothetical protein
MRKVLQIDEMAQDRKGDMSEGHGVKEIKQEV